MAALRILLSTHMFGHGGTDRVCAHLASGFAARGAEVEVVSFVSGGPGEAALLPLLGGARLTCLGRTGGSRTTDLIRLLPRFAGHLRAARPDVVLSTANNMNWPTAAAVRLAGLLGTRLALKVTNPILRAADAPALAAVRRAGYGLAFRAADAVLMLSDAEADILRAAFPAAADRFVTAANPYVTPAMLAITPAPDPAERTILAVGRFVAQKRLDLLLRAVAAMRTAPRVVILGDGADRAALEALARKLGIADRVEMPGFVSDVGPWLSRYEGLPAAVLEAMAANMPVVSTDCFAAARDLVGTAEGCLVAAAEPPAFAAALEAVLAAPRPTTLKAVAARYTIDRAVDEHLAVLARLAGRTLPVAAAPGPEAPVAA
jgi:glycosyltransferase involved in cell wall biosynthesis